MDLVWPTTNRTVFYRYGIVCEYDPITGSYFLKPDEAKTKVFASYKEAVLSWGGPMDKSEVASAIKVIFGEDLHSEGPDGGFLKKDFVLETVQKYEYCTLEEYEKRNCV